MNEFDAVIRLLNSSQFFYIICADIDGKYSYINENYARTFQYISHNFVGQPYYITMHPDDRKICEEVSYKCIQQPERTFPATIRKLDGKGGYIVTQWEYKAMFNESGIFTGMFCLGYDVTELDRKKELLKEVAFSQAHLVRAPLANILGFANILHKMELDENVKHLVEMLYESAMQMDTVIRQIVDKTYE